MLFSDYVTILKLHFKKTVSNEELCELLFNAVVLPLDLLNKNGDPFYLSKVTVSKMMNDKQGVPRLIRDNVYEPAVLSEIVAYFNNSVVPRLIPECDDLCFTIMKSLSVDETVSPRHLAEFEILATTPTVGAFLAEVFLHVVMTDIHIAEKQVSQRERDLHIEQEARYPELVLRGAIDGGLSDFAPSESLSMQLNSSCMAYRDRVVELFTKAAVLHPPKPGVLDSAFSPPLKKIEEDERDLLKSAANALDIVLPEDFFELGDLREKSLPPAGLSLNGGSNSVSGSSEACEKYELICTTLNELDGMFHAGTFADSLKLVQCTALVLENKGNAFDENVRVRLELPKGAVFLPTDFLKLDESTLDYLIHDCDFNGIFGIKRGESFLDYGSACQVDKPMSFSAFQPIDLCREESRDRKNEISGLFDCRFIEGTSTIQIEVEFDEILQHTAIAFPQVLPLKSVPDRIEYSITSKHMPDVISGSIGIVEQ